MQRGVTATTPTAMAAVSGVAVSTSSYGVVSAPTLVVAPLYTTLVALLVSVSLLITLTCLVVLHTHA